MTIHVAGLGPGPSGLLTLEVRDLLMSGRPVIVATRHHPCVKELDAEGTWDDCDRFGKPGQGAEVHEVVAAYVVDALAAGGGVFAVPGHPLMSGSAAPNVLALAQARGIEIEIYAGLNYADALYVSPLQPEEDVRTLDGLAAIVRRLNAPGGCPWDQEQTHESLRKYLLEETYETLEALDSGDRAAMAEELGDLLLQIFMHVEVARREGTFSLGDVTGGIGRKLIRRHPHVFASGDARTASEVEQNWEKLKQLEKPDGSALGGVPAGMPALAASQSLQSRARKVGFDWPDIDGPLEKLREEIAEFARAADASEREDEFGDILFVAANIADRLGLDAEQCLRAANRKFRTRFELVEQLAGERGVRLDELQIEGLDALWDEAKARLAARTNAL
jgi:tetrapyrrole methylase family protein/MazG family protein